MEWVLEARPQPCSQADQRAGAPMAHPGVRLGAQGLGADALAS